SDEWFAQARTMVVQLTEELRRHPYDAYLFLEDKWHAHFQDPAQIERGLDFLLLWYRDVLLAHFGQADDIVFADYLQRLNEDALRTPESRIQKQMTSVLDARRRLDANVNARSVMEQLVWKLQEGSTHV
ncbi:MAG TPA: DNA polymerase III subunit delta' C-terminal domain-containing protein, partial [Bacillales bacterium]|nr:DNA polymerase III subunit delta' C-terminal domain-containing protein [Bacillales bacterium]